MVSIGFVLLDLKRGSGITLWQGREAVAQLCTPCSFYALGVPRAPRVCNPNVYCILSCSKRIDLLTFWFFRVVPYLVMASKG